MTKKEENDEYNYLEDLNNLEIPNMLKVGFAHHIHSNNIKIKSKSELAKYLDKFKKESAGV
ncbi:MAG: hypothetical protein IJH63_03110 [Methanobrevibacter sp.]|nr:hypothetical protein [Methanobrevibacter sp.]